MRVMSCTSYFRWLKQEYEIPFPLNKQPPVHMPIAYGLVNISKSTTSTGSVKTGPHSQAFTMSQSEGGALAATSDVEILGTATQKVTFQHHRCSLCGHKEEVCC